MRNRKDIEKDTSFGTEINTVTNEILLDIRDLLLEKCVKSTFSAPSEMKSEPKGKDDN